MTGGSETRTVTNVQVSGSAVELTVDPAVEHGETGLRVGYTIPTGTGANPIQDQAGNDADRLSNRSVTNTDAQAQAAPEITSGGPFTVAEGTTAVATLTASDEDTASDQLVWTIPQDGMGGADADKFTLSSTGVLAFSAVKDYENPDDADGDRTYEVTVQVSDDDNSVTADMLVTLENVPELTSLTGPAMVDYPENKALRVAAYVASSEEDREGLDWILSGADANRFQHRQPGRRALRFDIDSDRPRRTSPATARLRGPGRLQYRQCLLGDTWRPRTGRDTVTLDVSVTVGDRERGGDAEPGLDRSAQDGRRR